MPPSEDFTIGRTFCEGHRLWRRSHDGDIWGKRVWWTQAVSDVEGLDFRVTATINEEWIRGYGPVISGNSRYGLIISGHSPPMWCATLKEAVERAEAGLTELYLDYIRKGLTDG